MAFHLNFCMETVSRNTCFLKTQSGGLGLDNFDLRCKSLGLAGMISTLGSPSDSSFFLCKYFVGRRLSRLRPEWAFLRDTAATSATSAFSPSSFYDSCLSILSSKKVYSKLLQSNSPGPILSHHWAPFVSPAFQHGTGLWFETTLRKTLRKIIRMTFSGLFCYMLLNCMIP